MADAAPNVVGWTNLYPDLEEISAVSPTEAWAAGEFGRLLHLSGGTWSVVDPPSLQGVDLRDVAMLSNTAGWAAGRDRAFQYDGTAWHERSAGLGQDLVIDRVAPRGTDDVWATGAQLSITGTTTLVHWDGTDWRAAGPALATGVYLYDIAFSGPADGWATGFEMTTNGDLPVLLHFDGTAWSRVPGPPGASYCYHIARGTSDALWITGDDAAGNGAIYRYSAGAWTGWSTPDGSATFAIYMAGPAAGWVSTGTGMLLHWDGRTWAAEFARRQVTGLAGAGGQVWGVGFADTVLARDAGGAWHQQRGGPTDLDLYAVVAPKSDEAWAVGLWGTILHYKGTIWQRVPTDFTESLNGVAMVSPAEGYAVGDQIIARWDGAAWTAVARPPVVFNGVAVAGPGEGWAIGEGGVLWHLHNGLWAAATSPTTDRLTSIVLDAPEHGWAAGYYRPQGGAGAWPRILEYSGGAWVDRSPSVEGSLPRALALSPDHTTGWAVGDVEGPGVSVLRLAGGQWAADPASPTDRLFSTSGEALGEAWALGLRDAYHYAGGRWQHQDLPSSFVGGTVAMSIALVPGRGGWVVGTGGKIMRYNPLAPGQRFYDVPLSNPFASYIEYMAAHNIVSGYADNTFHPYANITRAQLTKMVVGGLGWTLVNPVSNTFADVPPSHTFYTVIETAAAHGVISGYTCGGPGEPCDAQHRAYFRPQNAVTRSQLTKIIVLAKGWGTIQPTTPRFVDVPASHTFYGYVEQAAAKGIVNGYLCGGPGEPCPGSYFRPAAPATRAQLSKILYLALTQP